MPLNLSPLCNFLPKKFNTLKTYFYKVSVPFLVHYCTCYINKLSDRLFNSLAWRKKGTREIPIVHLKLSFKDCPYLQVHQLKSFQIQIQLVHNKIEGVSPWKSSNHIYKEMLSCYKEILSWNFKKLAIKDFCMIFKRFIYFCYQYRHLSFTSSNWILQLKHII